MKSFITKLLLLLLVAAAGYSFISTYLPVREGMVAVVFSNKSNAPVTVYPPGSRFIPQGILSWLYHIETVALEKRIAFEVKLAVPSLKGLKDEFYGITVPVSADYLIKWDSIDDYNLFRDGSVTVSRMIQDNVSRLLADQLQPFMIPVYRGPALEVRKGEIKDTITKNLTDRLAGRGIELKKLEISDSWTYPDYVTYQEGLRYLADLRRIEMENAKSISILKNRMQGDKIQEEALFKKYREMSRIIKENPDILKYIYIDKLPDNLKVIVSSDRSVVPMFLEEGKNQKSVSEKGEINNLR